MKYQIQMSDKYQFCGKMMIWFEFHVDFTWKFNDVEKPNHQKHEKSMWWFSENQMTTTSQTIFTSKGNGWKRWKAQSSETLVRECPFNFDTYLQHSESKYDKSFSSFIKIITQTPIELK